MCFSTHCRQWSDRHVGESRVRACLECTLTGGDDEDDDFCHGGENAVGPGTRISPSLLRYNDHRAGTYFRGWKNACHSPDLLRVDGERVEFSRATRHVTQLLGWTERVR